MSKAIQGPKRNRLLPNNVETLLFLKHNLRAVGYKSDLPDTPAELKCPNSSQYDMRLEEHEDGEEGEEDMDLNVSISGATTLSSSDESDVESDFCGWQSLSLFLFGP